MTEIEQPVHRPVRGRDGLADRPDPLEGDIVLARDGAVGRVERVVRTERGVPHHVVLTVGRVLRRHPVVPCELITRVDRAGAVVRVRGRRGTIRSLPEAMPLVI
jgi:hypothetical protein